MDNMAQKQTWILVDVYILIKKSCNVVKIFPFHFEILRKKFRIRFESENRRVQVS